MSYCISFSKKMKCVDKVIWMPVGDKWVYHTSATSAMIKAVCGSYPSHWDGKKCSELLPILSNGVKLLQSSPQEYRQFESGDKWGTVEMVLEFLKAISRNCEAYPDAVLDVDCE